MPTEKAAGTIVFKKEGGKIYYLLLHSPRGMRWPAAYWDFPKGHVEKGERPLDTAKRETMEETGLANIEIAEGFEKGIRYFFKFEGKTILKFVTFFLARAVEGEIRVSSEHIGYQWAPYEQAMDQLKFKNAKEILKKANNFLMKNG